MREASHPDDPRNLIREAYRIEGIGPEDARSIFFDWALGLPESRDAAEAARALRAHHAGPADHPISQLLDEAAAGMAQPRGRRGRRPR